jgi:hypothetical protein
MTMGRELVRQAVTAIAAEPERIARQTKKRGNAAILIERRGVCAPYATGAVTFVRATPVCDMWQH